MPERKKAVFIDSFLSQRTRLLFLSCCLCPFSIQKGHRSFLDHIGRCWQFISPQFLKISFVFMVNFEGSKTPEVVDAVGFQPTASKVTTQYGASGVTRTPDLLITNQLLYRLSYTSISIFDSDHNTIFLSQRQHPFQFSPSMRLSCFCILLYVLLQVFLQNKCCHFFILHFRVIVNCGKIEKICRCISAILS